MSSRRLNQVQQKEYRKRTFNQYSWQQLVCKSCCQFSPWKMSLFLQTHTNYFADWAPKGQDPASQQCLISPTKLNCFIWPHQGRPTPGRPSRRSRARAAFQPSATLQACAQGETCTDRLKRSHSALWSAPQAGPWRGRTHGKLGLPRLHNPSTVFWIRNLKFSTLCPVREYFSGLDSVGLRMGETSFFFSFIIPSFIFTWVRNQVYFWTLENAAGQEKDSKLVLIKSTYLGKKKPTLKIKFISISLSIIGKNKKHFQFSALH